MSWGGATEDSGSDTLVPINTSIVTSQLNGLNDSKDVTQLYSTRFGGFAALRKDGSVVTWGVKWAGADSSAVASQLDGSIAVTQIYSNWNAFVAKRADGSIVTWGAPEHGGDSRAVANQLTDIATVNNIWTDDWFKAITPNPAILSITPTAADKTENSGAFTFTINRTGDTTSASTVTYTVLGGTATPDDFTTGNDFPTRTISFNTDQTSYIISIPVADDSLFEADETFNVVLSNPTGATLGTSSASGTIRNDDPVPTLPEISLIPSAPISEGNSGTTWLTFIVARTSSTSDSSVNYAVLRDTATADDFTNSVLPSGIVKFTTNVVGETIKIPIAGDTFFEADETFKVVLSNPTGATLGTDSVIGTILNDDNPTGNGRFDITLDFAQNMADKYKKTFQDAAARWQSIITADIPDYGNIDDVKIKATIAEIDGIGKVLGSAGPTLMRLPSYLPIKGEMTFDIVDVDWMIGQGIFNEVILHEMCHVLGLGTLWEQKGLKLGGDYIGENALREYQQYQKLQGIVPAATNVPLEDRGDTGTIGAHWRESIFDTELMTGWSEDSGTMPISKITVGGLADLGYLVDYNKADPYLIPTRLVSPVKDIVLAGSWVDSNEPSANNDTLLGTFDNESLSGLAGDDKLYGLQGNDSLTGGAGNDSLDGGDGTDMAVYTGNLANPGGSSANFNVSKTSPNVGIKDNVNSNGTDTVQNFEKIKFDDLSLNLTIQNKATTTNIPAATLKVIQELYVGFFKRIPDANGLEYWIEQHKAGKTVNQIADAFYDAGVQYSSSTGYSATMTSAEFIKIVYANVLGRTGNTAPNTTEIDFWNQKLIAGAETRGSVVTTMLDTVHTQYVNDPVWGWVGKLLDNKAAVASKVAVEWGITYNDPSISITKGMEIASAVTVDSVTEAINLVGVNGVFV